MLGDNVVSVKAHPPSRMDHSNGGAVNGGAAHVWGWGDVGTFCTFFLFNLVVNLTLLFKKVYSFKKYISDLLEKKKIFKLFVFKVDSRGNSSLLSLAFYLSPVRSPVPSFTHPPTALAKTNL